MVYLDLDLAVSVVCDSVLSGHEDYAAAAAVIGNDDCGCYCYCCGCDLCYYYYFVLTLTIMNWNYV